MQLRYYQREACDAVFDYWRNGGGNPLIDLATGTGKSLVLATLCKELIEAYPSVRILMLTHVRELVSQNAQALLRAWSQAPLGINSAGLGRRYRGYDAADRDCGSEDGQDSLAGHREFLSGNGGSDWVFATTSPA